MAQDLDSMCVAFSGLFLAFGDTKIESESFAEVSKSMVYYVWWNRNGLGVV
jgi:hypothetical protein